MHSCGVGVEGPGQSSQGPEAVLRWGLRGDLSQDVSDGGGQRPGGDGLGYEAVFPSYPQAVSPEELVGAARSEEV